jgi:hypothetical protein
MTEENQFFLLFAIFLKLFFVASLVELVESFQNMSLVLALDQVLWMKNDQK